MSYCRWSTDNFRCDVYCYADVSGGYTTHVAGNRLVGQPDEPALPEPGSGNEAWDGWSTAYNEWLRGIDSCKREAITLPHAGESFNDGTLEEFRDRLKGLRDLGYQIPDFVFAVIEEEIQTEIDDEEQETPA